MLSPGYSTVTLYLPAGKKPLIFSFDDCNYDSKKENKGIGFDFITEKYVNMKGLMPGKKIVILGSGDIGLIMARRMTLEGAKVMGVAELMPYSNGLSRNIAQCLNDFDIPLYLSHTVKKVCGKDHIEKVVIDEENKPLEFATVRIHKTALGTNTNLDGDYSISTAEIDTIDIVFSCIGYKTEKRQLIKAKGDIILNMRMLKTAKELQEINVTEYKKQTGSMIKIDRDSYKFAPDVSGGSVEAMLTTMAGVNSTNEMSSQYSVRGGSYDENSVYINGIEIYRPQLISSGQQEGLSIINPDLVGEVKFSTGGFSAEYGDKMSSVLDIMYREPQTFEGSVSMSLMGGSFALGQNLGKFSQLHGVRYKQNASLLSSMETKGEYDPNYFDYQTHLAYKLNKKFKVFFLGNIAINNYNFKPVNRTTNFGTSQDAKQFTVYFDGQEKDKFETYFGALSLNYNHSKSSNFTLLASGYLTNELVAYDISGEYWLDQAGTTGSSGETIGGELGVGRYHEHARNRLKASVYSLSLKGNTGLAGHSLSYGVSFNHEKIHDRSREWELRDSAGYSLPSTGDAVHVIYNLSSRQDFASNRVAFFAQDTYKINSFLGLFSFNGGVRLSYWDFNKEFLTASSLPLTSAFNTILISFSP